MIVITGAAGKTGKALIERLAHRAEKVRAIAHRPQQKQTLFKLGAEDVVVADLLDGQQLVPVFQTADAIYHICPNMHPQEYELGLGVMEAARTAGVERFVYHSVLHPQVEAMPHHWQKMRVEEKLFESGLTYTILQPAAYMQNIVAYWDGMVNDGVLALPYSPETRINMVDLRDVAEAAAIVLIEKGHEWATYELCGPETLSQNEVAQIIGRQLGRNVRAEAVSLQDWQRQARSSGLGEYALQTLVNMFQYYERYGFYGNPQVLSGLLGRPARNFTHFIEDIINNGHQLR